MVDGGNLAPLRFLNNVWDFGWFSFFSLNCPLSFLWARGGLQGRGKPKFEPGNQLMSNGLGLVSIMGT